MTKHKILVVDDEESLCEILQFNLEVEGYEVDTAYSAEQALGMLLVLLLSIVLHYLFGRRHPSSPPPSRFDEERGFSLSQK